MQWFSPSHSLLLTWPLSLYIEKTRLRQSVTVSLQNLRQKKKNYKFETVARPPITKFLNQKNGSKIMSHPGDGWQESVRQSRGRWIIMRQSRGLMLIWWDTVGVSYLSWWDTVGRGARPLGSSIRFLGNFQFCPTAIFGQLMGNCPLEGSVAWKPK